jgi:VCBS repeat-containing protein
VNLIGTYDSIQAANDAASTLAGYRIELVGTVTGEAATITKENLTVVGGADDTGITLTLNGVQNITLDGAAPINVVGNDLSNAVEGNDGANVITSGKAGDTLNGGDGDDTFIVSADLDDATGQGSRTVTLGDGSTITVSLDHLSGEGDSLNGGAGVDTVEFVSAAGAAGFVFDRANYPGTISGIERFIGTDGNDIILLPQSYTSGTDPLYMEGGAGNDVLQGSNAQADHILGGADDDLISGLGGNDTLEGGSGNDEIWGGLGADKLYGEDGNDTLVGGKGDDLLDGGTNSAVGFNRPSNPASGDAAAIIASAFGGDTADYSSLTTGVLANLGDAATWPAAIPAHSAIDSNGANDAVGTDTLVDIENLTGGNGDDILAGDGNDNILKGGAGSDTLLGGAGDDLLIGGDDNVGDGLIAGAGNDVLILGNGGGTAKGEGGDDLIYGGSSGDWLYGEDDGNPNPADAGADTIFAGGGNDHIEGGGGADKLYGEDGDDTLIGGLGNDIISGGTGNDTFVYKVGDGSDIIDGGTETGSTFPNYDVLKIAGDAESRTFTIGKSILADPQNVTPTDDRPDLLVTYSGTGGTTVRADEIEGIEITLHAGGGTVNVGDLSGTAIEPSTIVINGGTGNDTIDLTGLAGTKVVINDIDGIGGDTDSVKLAGKWADYNVTESNGTFTISLGGHVVATTTNVEQFVFTGESGGGIVTADQLLNDAPLAIADSNSVVEAGGVANGIGGIPSATGNVLTNDTDADSGNFDTKTVTSVQFGIDSAANVPSNNNNVTVAGVYGTLTIHADGSYAYALDNNNTDTQGLGQGTQVSEIFTYTMADAHGVESSAELKINITGTNDAPVVDVIGAFTIDEDTTWSVSHDVIKEFIDNHVADVDTPQAGLTYSVVVNGVTISTFTSATIPAEISYTPAANFNGQLNAQLAVSDGIATTTRDFNINFTPVNDAPIAVNDYFSTNEDTALSGLKLFANDSDVEGGPLTANGITVGGQLGGSISFEQNGTLYYKPLANESGYAVLQYSVSDGNLTSTGTVTIDVRPIADTATISGSGLGNEDATAALSLNIALGDTDGSEKVTRVELSGFPAGATFNQGALEGGVWVITNTAGVNTSGLTMTPPANYAGNFNLSVSATVLDSATLSDLAVHTDTKVSTGSIGIVITPVNDAPVITSGTTGGEAENAAISNVVYQTVASDVDGTLPSYTLSGDDAALFDISSTGAVTFKALPNFETPADANHDNVYNIVVNASDGVAPAATQSVAITVADVNEAPTITSAAMATAAENTATGNVVYQIAATDPESTTLTYTLIGTDANRFNIDAMTGAVTFKASPNFEAPTDNGGDNGYNFTVTASDGTNQTNQAVALNVTNVNEAPVFTSGTTASVAENVPISTAVYIAAATDVDSSNLSYSLSGTDANRFNIDATTGQVTFKASPDYELPADNGADNVYNITVVASDGTAQSTKDVTITVTDAVEVVNLAPTDIQFTGNIDLTASQASGQGNDPTTVADGAGIFKMTALDPDNTNGFLYKFGGSTAQVVNIDGSETFTVGASSGQVTTTALRYNDGVESVTISTPTVTDADGATRNETVTVQLGTYAGDNINGSSVAHDQVIYGFGGNDTISGGSGNDWIAGGVGTDNFIGGSGKDTFVFNSGDSTATISSLSWFGSTYVSGIDGYDVVKDFNSAQDKLDFKVAPLVASNTSGVNGTDSREAWSDTTILRSHAISDGIVSFDDTNNFSSALSINNAERLGMAVEYLTRNDLGNAGSTVAFRATLSGVDYTFVYQQGGDTAGSNYTLVALRGAAITNFNALITTAAVDPIILDLDHNGFAFTSVDDGVKFDINADGKLDQVAWTKTDGILAFDVDGNGKIDNGSEIFTPNFAGGTHAGGVAALSTLDVNHDGKIDASDTGFDKLLVWQDANGNGVSDESELKGLHDYDITGISLDADSSEGYIDGQALFAEGSFTYADGSTGSFVEVGFDTLFSDAPDHVLVGTDGDDILAAMPGLTQMTGGAGADTFVLDPSALHELDMADIITDYKSNEGDAVDVSKLLDTLLGHQATGEEAAANVRTTIAGNDTTVSVQVATDSWKDVAVLQNHTEAVKILFDDDKHSANISHV